MSIRNFLERFLPDSATRHRHTIAEIVRFCVTGATNSAVDFGLYVYLTRSMRYWARHYVLASAIAYTVAIGMSFVLNNFWTFRRDHRGLTARSAKFLIVSFSALGLHVLVFSTLTGFGLHDIVAKVIATSIGGVWNYTLYKSWAFAERQERA